MRKEYYNYVVKLPVLLHELFRGKVADYHFSDMTVVMNLSLIHIYFLCLFFYCREKFIHNFRGGIVFFDFLLIVLAYFLVYSCLLYTSPFLISKLTLSNYPYFIIWN